MLQSNAIQPRKIEVKSDRLIDLMFEVKRGNLRIPSFQREFVWKRTDIHKLLDSMYREYPIGTLFLWQAPVKYNYFIRRSVELDQPEIEDGKQYTLILDGQQRLTSLYVVSSGLEFAGEDYGKFVVDLDNSDSSKLAFRYRKPDNRRWIAVKDILSQTFPPYDELSLEFRQKYRDYQYRLSNYPFSTVIVKDVEFEDAIEIFERLNQQGTRLSRYDLIAASVLTGDFDLRERTQKDIVEPFREAFGEIAETSVPQALAINIKGNTENATQLNLKTEEIQEVWLRTVECFKQAVDFVRQNLGVARVDFLPYDGILPVLAHYFYYSKKNRVLSSEHREQLERWFWRVAFSERYSGSSQTRMTEDAAWIRDLIDKDRPIDYSITVTREALTNASMAYTTSAVRNGILCLLNLQKPLHFENGTEVRIAGDHFSKFTLAERHHIFPVGFLKMKGYEGREVHRLPNFTFIPGELNRRISDDPPSEYMKRIAKRHIDVIEFEKVMKTHLIPVGEDSAIWSDDYEAFLEQRADLIIEEIKVLCGIVTRIEKEHRDPVIDTIEIGLRDEIHETLQNNYGVDYWRLGVKAVAGDVHSRIESKIGNHVNTAPGETKSRYNDDLRSRWDFCDVSDYSKIITNRQNWPYFVPTFRSKGDCILHLDKLREYRNAVKHNRDVDTVLEHSGQAAIIWLSRVLNLDMSEYGIF